MSKRKISKDEDNISIEAISDEALQKVTGQIFVGQSVLIAHQLGLFKLISKQPLSIQKIAKSLSLGERASQAIISCASSMGLVEFVVGGYRLSQIGKIYLDSESPGYYGGVLELLIQENEIMNYESIKKAILSNKHQANKGKDLFSSNDSISNTEPFIRSLHQKAFKPAFHWANIINLKGHKKFIDIGGGSGIHTIAVCLKNPELIGFVCDRRSVILHTKKYISDFDLENRISLIKLNMWKDLFPEGDVYFFGDIFHDWERKKCDFLTKKCFQRLPKGGKIILHEMLFNDDKTGPFLTSAYNMKMMAWTEGQQFNHYEIQDILKKAGFKEIKIEKSFGNWSLVVGTKR